MGDKEKVVNNKWEKVTFAWDFRMGLQTGVLMDGRVDLSVIDPRVFDPEANKKVHGIFGIEAISLPHGDRELRQGEMTIAINGCMLQTFAPTKDALIDLLQEEMKRRAAAHSLRSFRHLPFVVGPEGKSWADNQFKIRFVMDNGEQFCHYVMDLGKAVFDALGVHDEHGYHLASFSFKRESFVKLDSSWITFPHWLRMEHRLPIEGPEDRGF